MCVFSPFLVEVPLMEDRDTPLACMCVCARARPPRSEVQPDGSQWRHRAKPHHITRGAAAL